MPQRGDVTTGPVPGGDGLVRALSHRQITMIALGSALGTGLFLGSGPAISLAGPAVVLSYLIGAVLIGVIAVALGEMTTVHPVRGAFGAIAAEYLGPWAGFLMRWGYWAAAVVAIGGEVVAGAIYLRFWWPQIPLAVAVVVLAAVVLTVNLSSVRSFGTAEFWLSGIKVTALLVFLVAGVCLVVFGGPRIPATGLDNLTAHGGFFPNGAGSVWVALSVVMFAFIGFETISITAAEAENPVRSIRTAMRATLWRLGVFYVLAVALVVTLIPWNGVSTDETVESSPFVLVFAELGVPAAAWVTNAILLVAALSAANANLYGASRLVHSLAHDRLAPRSLARVGRRGVPVAALLVSASGMAVATALSASNVGGVFTILASLATFTVLIVWGLVLATYVAFRRRRRDVPAEPGRLRLPGGVGTACVGFGGLVAVVATAAVAADMRVGAVGGTALVAVLLTCYAGIRARRR